MSDLTRREAIGAVSVVTAGLAVPGAASAAASKAGDKAATNPADAGAPRRIITAQNAEGISYFAHVASADPEGKLAMHGGGIINMWVGA